MKKTFCALTLMAAVLAVAMPTQAKADSFSFSFSDGPDYYAPRGYIGHGPGPHHYRPYHHHPRPIVYMPPPVVYAPPPRTIVYTQPTQYVVPSTVIANQTSPTYYDGDGQLCREYQSTGRVAGSRGQVYGTACLQADGSWRVVD